MIQIVITKHNSFFITKLGRYYKMSGFHYQTRQVIQNIPIITRKMREAKNGKKLRNTTKPLSG